LHRSPSPCEIKAMNEPSEVEAAAMKMIHSWARVESGDEVSGLVVREEIPNCSSIRASMESHISCGLRAVPIEIFSLTGKDSDLAKEIDITREINPLIVVVDGHPDGPAYILEGSHRIDALKHLGVSHIPALVVFDESAEGSVKDGHGMTIPLEKRFPMQGKPRSEITVTHDGLSGKDGEVLRLPGGRIEVKTLNMSYSPRGQSVIDFVVEEGMRGKGIGTRLLQEAKSRHEDLGGQVSSVASLKLFYKAGFRNPILPEGSLAAHVVDFENLGGSLYMAKNNRYGNPYEGTVPEKLPGLLGGVNEHQAHQMTATR